MLAYLCQVSGEENNQLNHETARSKRITYSAFVRREPAEVTCEWVNATKRIASVGDSK
jgi:hypothetical protein